MALSPLQTHYRRLGVPPQASPRELRAAFRARSKELHPDINSEPSAAEEFDALVQAYATLSDPASRARYDALIQGLGGEGAFVAAAGQPLRRDRSQESAPPGSALAQRRRQLLVLGLLIGVPVGVALAIAALAVVYMLFWNEGSAQWSFLAPGVLLAAAAALLWKAVRRLRRRL